mmetsp:Transcript_38844/g.103126  ORF Transcript_38844/g.103126 Transcript_38844/m.103126 type:complete len:125 (-) Transcript_38844:1733-2107(-)
MLCRRMDTFTEVHQGAKVHCCLQILGPGKLRSQPSRVRKHECHVEDHQPNKSLISVSDDVDSSSPASLPDAAALSATVASSLPPSKRNVCRLRAAIETITHESSQSVCSISGSSSTLKLLSESA